MRAFAVSFEQLEKLGCRIDRDHPKLPDLAQTARTYRQLLAASYIADLPPETIKQISASAKTLSPNDQSYSAAVVRGLTISHADWIRQKPRPRRPQGALARLVSRH
jgi:amidase